MKTRLVIDEDSVYEIDEECERQKKEKERRERMDKGEKTKRKGKNLYGLFAFGKYEAEFSVCNECCNSLIK